MVVALAERQKRFESSRTHRRSNRERRDPTPPRPAAVVDFDFDGDGKADRDAGTRRRQATGSAEFERSFVDHQIGSLRPRRHRATLTAMGRRTRPASTLAHGPSNKARTARRLRSPSASPAISRWSETLKVTARMMQRSSGRPTVLGTSVKVRRPTRSRPSSGKRAMCPCRAISMVTGRLISPFTAPRPDTGGSKEAQRALSPCSGEFQPMLRYRQILMVTARRTRPFSGPPRAPGTCSKATVTTRTISSRAGATMPTSQCLPIMTMTG